MDTVIGLGQAGCNIADAFAKYDQYKIYKIDAGDDTSEQSDWSWASYELAYVDAEKDGVYRIKEQSGPEEYEENCPNLSNLFKNIKGGILFVVGGSGDISGAALKILECLKHCEINILYIRPDLRSVAKTKIANEWVAFNILQEYARSGLFKRIWLIDNSQVEKHLGNVPIIGYHDRLNEMIVSTLHMINVYDHIDSVVDTFSEPPIGRRISTIGIYDSDSNENKLFYLLDNVREMRYYYAINKKKLETDSDIMKKIRKQTKDQIATSYGIYSTNYEQDYVYTVAHTSEIQRQKSEKST